jgi:hypothetical protein
MDSKSLSAEVDRVAHAMCEEMGLDPNEMVWVDEHDSLAPFEIHAYYRNFKQLPIVDSGNVRVTVEDSEARMRMVERWRSFRRAAAQALIGWRAVHRYTMTEAR